MNNWKGWILPGLVTVVLLTALSTYFKIEAIEASLTSNTSQTLASDYPWASLSADGRDITVGGISPSPTAKAAALELAKTVYGVRVAKDGAELLELVSPYPFSAVKNNGTVSLSGNVLNSGMRAAVVATAEKTNPDTNIADELTEARGSPDGFEGKVGFALQQLSLLRDGTVKLSDSQLSLSGTAASLDAYEELIDNLATALPDGVETASIELLPPIVSPYVWQANMSDGKIVLDGFAPVPMRATALLRPSRRRCPVRKLTTSCGSQQELLKISNQQQIMRFHFFQISPLARQAWKTAN